MEQAGRPAAVLPVFAVATPSHLGLLRQWFLASLPADCRARVHQFDAAPVRWARGQWHRVVAEKLHYLDRAFDLTPAGAIFVFADVDIRFYRPFAGELRLAMHDMDLLFQDSRPGEPHRLEHLCTGFMAVRNNARTREFFRRACEILLAADNPQVGDQSACIQALQQDPGALRHALLPSAYWVPPRTGRHWVPGEPLRPPADLVLHHACRTVGTQNKHAQLAAVLAARGPAGHPVPGGAVSLRS